MLTEHEKVIVAMYRENWKDTVEMITTRKQELKQLARKQDEILSYLQQRLSVDYHVAHELLE